MSDLLKIMHCGCEYDLNGEGIKIPAADFLGNGSDGDCVLDGVNHGDRYGNIFIEAKEYNFCNLTVCSGTKLWFCGNGMPIIRVTGTFENYGCIMLRNPFIDTESEVDVNGYLFHIHCNNYYSNVTSLAASLQPECLNVRTPSSGEGSYGKGGYGGAGGEDGEDGTHSGSATGHGVGGKSLYANAGGGGGGGGIWQGTGYDGCDTPGDGIGGDGGVGGFGGSGGYGYCQGGKGGNSNGGCRGGRGGNSPHIPGAGGDGQCGGRGGNSYRCKGGKGGVGTYCGGDGGHSYWMDGGDRGGINGCCCCQGAGGSSVYGNGGTGCCACGMDASKIAWNGVYGFFVAADTITNDGEIQGRGGNGANNDTRGAEIRFFYNNYENTGTISCAKGSGGGCDGFFRKQKFTE